MEPIKIDIKDGRLYCDVALLVDYPEFIKDLQKLRDKWEIKELIPLNKFTNWLDELQKRPTQKRQITSVEGRDQYDEEIARQRPHIDLECDIRDLRIKHKRTDNFDKAIMYALVCGAVPNKVYKTAYSQGTGSFIPWRFRGETERVAIFITPQTTDNDLMGEWRDARKFFFKPKNDYLRVIGNYKTGKDEIRKHRQWYLAWFNGKSFKEITDKDEKETGGRTFIETVKKSVYRYKAAMEFLCEN